MLQKVSFCFYKMSLRIFYYKTQAQGMTESSINIDKISSHEESYEETEVSHTCNKQRIEKKGRNKENDKVEVMNKNNSSEGNQNK